MGPEYVTVSAGGGTYTGWKKVTVRASMRQACRNFQLTTTEMSAAGASEYNFPPGTDISISANGDLVCKGYVNVYAPSGDAKSHTVEIEGRGKGQDFVDCAAKHKKGNFQKKKPDQIAQELDLWGLGLKAEVQLEPIDYFQLNQGETAHAAVERALRDQYASMVGQADGSIKITNAKAAKRHSGGLIEGHNIRSFKGRFSDEKRHSECEVKGQRRHGTKESDLRIKESAQDSGVKRNRPKILVHEGDTTKERAKRRAQNESDRAQGFSVAATIVVQGWRDDGGKLWEPNHLVFIQSPSLKLNGDLLIESVNFHQDEKQSWSEIHCVNPKAYQGKSGQANRSGGQWN